LNDYDGMEQNTPLCDEATKYIQDNGLQNERRLTQEEVVEDFRIISKTETDEEKTFSEKFNDDLLNLPPEDETSNNDDLTNSQERGLFG
jgi:hypothetical protein